MSCAMSLQSSPSACQRLAFALDGLERQVADLAARSQQPTHGALAATQDLASRHEALKSDVCAAIAELDQMLTGTSVAPHG